MTQQRVSPISLTSAAPAVATLSLQGAVGQSANLVEVKNSTGTILSLVDVSGNLNAPSLIPTGSTVPTNGVYLPAANTLGFATNSTVRMQVDSNGNVVIGGGTSSTVTFAIRKNPTGNSLYYNQYSGGTIQSSVTNVWFGYASEASTAAASFTLNNIIHFEASQSTIGAGSSVSNQYGFRARSSMVGAGNNYGFSGDIPSQANTWNFYAQGTAANYFAGQTTVGSTSLTLGSGSVAQQFGVVSSAATSVGAVIRGAASQTGNLQEWQNSAGTVLASVSNAGDISTKRVAIAQTNAGQIVLDVLGATSQTADLQQWRNSAGTVLASVDSAGKILVVGSSLDAFKSTGSSTTGYNGLTVSNSTNAGTYVVGTAGASETTFGIANGFYIYDANAELMRLRINSSGLFGIGLAPSNAQLRIGNSTAANAGLMVVGAASQSGNLFEVQNSSAVVLTSLTSAGTINFASGNTSATATIGAITAPVMVSGYITMQIAGTTVKVPYYNN